MRFLTVWCYENTIAAENSRRFPTTRCYSITGVVNPLPTAAELYGSDDALSHNLGLKGAAAKAAGAATFPTPLHAQGKPALTVKPISEYRDRLHWNVIKPLMINKSHLWIE